MFGSIFPLLASGALSVPVAATYPLDQFPEAIRHAASAVAAGRSSSRTPGVELLELNLDELELAACSPMEIVQFMFKWVPASRSAMQSVRTPATVRH